MKKIISWGMMLAAAFTLTNCAKEITNPDQQPETAGYPFEISASVVDDGMSTKWAEGDQINVFHALGDDKEYEIKEVYKNSDDKDKLKFKGKFKLIIYPIKAEK